MSKENQIIEMLEAMNHKLNIIQRQVKFLTDQATETSQTPIDEDNPSLYDPVLSQTMGELYKEMLRINLQKGDRETYPEYREMFDRYISESTEF